MSQKDTFLKKLRKKLNASQKDLLKLIEIVGVGKNNLIFQMPKDIIPLEAVWEKIELVGQEMGIEVTQTAGNYATLEDLDKIMGEIQWLWKGWIPKGMLTMIAGDPGVGKSAIVQHMVKIITTGGCFPLETVPVEPSSVIWIDTEASQQILKVRANTMGIVKNKVFIPTINGDMLAQPDLAIDNNREYIINMIEEVKPAMLVLDSLGGSHTRGENKVEDIKPILEFLALLARDYEIAVIVIHHLNKGREGESPEVSLYRIRGSTVIPAMCRSIIAIEPTQDKRLKFGMVKSNIARKGNDVGITPLLDKDGEFTGFTYEAYAPPPPKKNKREVVAEWVLEQLTKNKEGVDLHDLVLMGADLGFSRGNIYSARDILASRLIFTGTGNNAHWSVFTEEPDSNTFNSIKKHMAGKENTNGKHPTKSGTKRIASRGRVQDSPRKPKK